MKKILLISHSLEITGAPLSLFNIATILKKNNFDITVWSLKEGILSKNYKEKLNIDVKILNKDIKEDYFYLSKNISKFDFVIINTVVCDFFADICQNLGIPYIWIIRESQNIKQFIRNINYTNKCFKKCENSIYAVSEYAQDYFKNEFNINTNVIHNFVEDDYNSNIYSKNQKINFTIVGTIEDRKGVNLLIDAVCNLESKHQDKYELNILGEYLKGYSKYSKPLIEKTQKYTNIHWYGSVIGDEKQKIYEKTDVFVIPSLDEASSRVVLEACMMGRPVIVSENVGAKYMVNENTGWIVKTGDVESLKNCIENILNNPECLPKMGLAAREMYLNTSTPEIYKEKLEKIINEKIQNKKDNKIGQLLNKLYSVNYLQTHKVSYFLGIKIKQKYNQELSQLEKIFSVKSIDIHKMITICGLRIKIKNNKLIEQQRQFELQEKINKLNIEVKKQLKKEINSLKSQLTESIKMAEYRLCKYMPEEKYPEYLKEWFYKNTGKELNLDNPQTFNEKIQWMKLYDSTPLKTRLADKYLVRDWVKEKIGEEYLVPLLGVWKNFDDIDFDNLPDKFVLKANHGCAWNIIVKDKNKLDVKNAKNKFQKWLQTNFAYCYGLELHYKNIKPLIIAEQYIENNSKDLYDYKVWCFNGKAEYIQFLSERQTGLKMAFYDRDWNKQDFVYSYSMNTNHVEKPQNLEKLLTLAEKLSEGFPHVRIDFYILNDGTIKFGEMTFTSMSGACKWSPEDTDEKLGQLINLKIEE